MSSQINRRVVRQVLVEWKRSKGMAFDRITSSAFREHRLGSRERRMTGDFLFAVLRFFPMLLGLRWNPEDADDLRKLDGLVDSLESSSDIFSELVKRHESAKPIFSKDPERHLREIHGLPEFILKEISEHERSAWHDYLHDSMARASIGLRVSESLWEKMSAHSDIKPSQWLSGAFVMDESRDLVQLESEVGGPVEIQDEHSQIVGRILGVEPGMRVLDLCAGAGGKTLQLASIMGSRGEIFVNDVSSKRLEELKKRARRLGISNIRIWDPAKDKNFDRILIDAPCLGLGTLRRTPERLFRITREDSEAIERTQKNLIDQALAIADPSTEILYVTCSVRAAENMRQFMVRDNYQVVSIPDRLKDQMGIERANEFLTLAKSSSSYRLSLIDQIDPTKQMGFMQWGPKAGSSLSNSHVSGSLKGDAFFVALVKCKNLEGKVTRTNS